jgi:hypothetical protein
MSVPMKIRTNSDVIGYRAVSLKNKAIGSFVNSLKVWPWEWFCLMDLPPGCTRSNAERLIKEWRITYAVKEKISIAYQGILSYQPSCRLYLFVAGLNTQNEILSDREPRMGELYWSLIAQQSAAIEPIEDLMKVIFRTLYNNPPSGSWEVITPYNHNLLIKKVKQAYDSKKY